MGRLRISLRKIANLEVHNFGIYEANRLIVLNTTTNWLQISSSNKSKWGELCGLSRSC